MPGVRPGAGVSAWRGGITRAESRRATDSRGRRRAGIIRAEGGRVTDSHRRMRMKKRRIVYCLTGVCILAALAVTFLCVYINKPGTVSYEFENTPGNNIVMEIDQIRGAEYEIVPLLDMIISEPSPDWGIDVYLGDGASSLYFYASRSPGGYEGVYGGEPQILESVAVGGRQLRLVESGTYIEGDYRIASRDGNPFCYGVRLCIERSVWEKDKEKIIRLIESARVR